MPEDFASWLQQIPSTDGDELQLEGRLAECPPGQIAIIIDRSRLSFALEDVRHVIPYKRNGHALLQVCRGAMLLSIERLDDAAQSQRPFSLSVRPRITRIPPAPLRREAERRFLRTHGIVVDG